MEKTFPLISVSGSAFEMGYQHGRQAAPLIRKYLAWIGRLTSKPLPELAAAALRFAEPIRALSPRYMEEVHGLSDGAGISFAEAMLCQTRGEAAVALAERACTAFALTRSATAGGAVLAGQNQDLEPEYAACVIVLRVRPTDGRPKAVMLTVAGQLGYAGMNEHGVAHFANALYEYRWRFGLPHYPLKRMILEQRRVSDCVSLLRANRTCSAANVVLCDGAGDVADVEVRPEGIAEYPGLHADARVHTNHYLCDRFRAFERGRLPDSGPRLDRFTALVRAEWGKIGVESLKRMLADHDGDPAAVCRHGAAGMHSICGYIAEPGRSLLHVRRGHGCDGHWEAYPVA